MRRDKSGVRAGAAAPKKAWLISDAKLLALHRRLLRAVAQREREESGIERYAAARIAIWFDLRGADTVIESAAARMGDALAAARMNKARKNRSVVVVWSDEAGADWQDALEEARAHSLPVVFVCAPPDGRQARTRLPPTDRKLKPGEELPSITVDGYDVVAAYRVAHESIARARRDRGPTLLLLATYEIGGRAFTDAVADMERYLQGRGLLKTGTMGPREQGTKQAATKKARDQEDREIG